MTRIHHEDPHDREGLVLVAVLTTFVSLLPTAYAALISNSVTLLADLLRCSAEFLSILVSWIILRTVARSSTGDFNYGFGKLEQLARAAVGAALFVTFLVCLVSGIRRLIIPEEVTEVGFGLCLALVSVLGNGFLWWRNLRVFQRSGAPISDAQWRLFRAKTVATVVVALSLSGVLLAPGAVWTSHLDACGSIALALFMVWSAYTLFVSSVPDLIDCALEESVQGRIAEALEPMCAEFGELLGVRSRRTGSRMFIELRVTFDPHAPFGAVNAVAQRLAEAVEQQIVGAEVTVVPCAPLSFDQVSTPS